MVGSRLAVLLLVVAALGMASGGIVPSDLERTSERATVTGLRAPGVSRAQSNGPVTISNIKPKLDVNGDILRVQDGCLTKHEDTYYLYGARYQCCDVSEQPGCYSLCGWRNTTFAVYTSPDLQTWTLGSDNLLPSMTDLTNPNNTQNVAYFEPCALYNEKYDHWALWFNHPNTKATAVSKSPLGPFVVHEWEVPVPEGSDIYFWVDAKSGNAYAKHNNAGAADPKSGRSFHTVTQLTDDYLGLTDLVSNKMYPPTYPIPPAYQGAWPECSEGGAVFSYGGNWYVQFGACCCFCAAGSNAYTFISTTGPLGPYEFDGDVIPFNPTTGKYLTGAQQFGVAQLVTKSGEVVPMYIGQRFGSADDGKKCHDYQYWAPIKFDAGGHVMPFEWVDEWTVELA